MNFLRDIFHEHIIFLTQVVLPLIFYFMYIFIFTIIESIIIISMTLNVKVGISSASALELEDFRMEYAPKKANKT